MIYNSANKLTLAANFKIIIKDCHWNQYNARAQMSTTYTYIIQPILKYYFKIQQICLICGLEHT